MIKALIFDFDGLLVDTEWPAYASWLELYQGYGCAFPLALWSAVLGGSGHEFDPCAYLEQQVGYPLDQAALRERRWQRKLQLVAQQPLLPGCASYIEHARQAGLKLAVASSNSREWVVGHLDRLGITALFDVIICSDDVSRVKPDPEIYQTALARLGVQAGEALAFEDAPNGLRAAQGAGIFCVVVPNVLTGQLSLEGAELRLASFEELPLAQLLALVESPAGRTASPSP